MKKNNSSGNILTEKVPIKHFLLIMRISFILLFTCVFCSMAEIGHSQNARVTINKRNSTLREVLNDIEKQTDYLFIYNDKVNANEKVSVKTKHEAVSKVLNSLLKDKDLDYSMEGNHIILSKKEKSSSSENVRQTNTVQQQKKQITGTVVDIDGMPIIGANIIEKETTNGTVTEINGNFILSVGRDAVVQISYLGYLTQEIKVDDNTFLNVILLEDTQRLDEVIVVGYGSVRKVNLTGAVAQVSGDVLENRPIVSVGQALQGTIGNLNIASNVSTGTGGGGAPGAKMSFNIRGITSLSSGSDSSSASPLFVVDGIQSQDINGINPNDIESITVLKDAASAAIYGSSAPYGVVLITTKKGKKGSKPTINYNTNLGWSSYISVPTMLNSVEWAELINAAQQNTNGTNYLSDVSMQRIRDFYDGKITTSTVINPGRTGDTSWANFDDFGQGTANANVDWYSVYFKKSSFSQQHNISIQGGSENTNYYVGLGYNYKDGLFKYGTDSFERYSTRANLSSIINKWITANVRGSYTKGINDRPSSTGNSNFMQEISQKWPIIPFTNPDGNYSKQSNVEAYKNGGRIVSDDNLLVLTGELVITPLKGWDITANYTYKANNIANETSNLSIILYEASGKPYYQPSWSTADMYTRRSDNLSRERIDDTQHTFNTFTSYELDVKNHYLKGMIGFAQEYVHYYNLTASSGRVTLYNPELPTFETMYSDDNNQSIREPNKNTLTTRGVFGRINYSYKDKYLLELNGRYDGTSRYLKDVRFKFYPGVSGGYVVSQEDFWQNNLIDYVDFFKIRGSYGALGAASGGYYPFYPSLGVNSSTSTNWFFNGTRLSNISYPGLINPDLTWVTNKTIDFGFDLNLLKNRLSTSFDWYSRSSDDIIGPAEQLPAVLGAAAPSKNNASIRTNGFELSLGWRDRIKSIGLDYGIKTTLADSKSYVLKYPNATRMLGTWYDGARIGDIWGYISDGRYTQAEEDAGIDQNIQGNPKGPGSNWRAGDQKYKDLDGDGIITRGENTFDDPGDRRIIGNSTPRYTYGITLDAAWKGFDINMFFHGIGKRDAWISTGGVGNFWGTQNSIWQANFLTIHRDRWTPETPDGYFPKYYLNGSQNAKNQVVQTKYLQDASFIRFKNLQIGYSVPKTLLSKAGIEKLRIYVSGENLATLTNFVKTIDPEFAASDRGLAYPLQQTWSFGLNLNF